MAYYAPQPGQASVIPRRRSPSPDELVDARAQLDVLRRTKQEKELAEISKQIADLQGDKSLKTGNEGIDPPFFPLETRFSAKPKYLPQIFDNDFDPVNITRLCNDATVNRA